MIDLRYVKKLIEIIDDSTVDSIEITSDKGMKIRISKSPQQRGTVQMAPALPIPAIVPAAPLGRISPPQGMAPVTDAESAATRRTRWRSWWRSLARRPEPGEPQ